MARYKKKTVEIVEAVTFDELVQYGRGSGGRMLDGIPMQFNYKGMTIRRGPKRYYFVPSEAGTLVFSPDDMLIFDGLGKLRVLNRALFNMEFEEAL